MVLSSCLQATWTWQSYQELPYLTCSLLEQWKHGFFTKEYSPRLPKDLKQLFDPLASSYRLKQIHGALVWTPREILSQMSDSLVEGDGIMTDASWQSVWVASADCTPALIGDLRRGSVAAVHAGWRGTAKSILPVTISRFLSSGSRLEDLRVALGPAISGTVYQVSEEVATEVGSSLFSTNILANLAHLVPFPILPDAEVGKVRLDVRYINLHQLKQLGLQAEQISIAPYCTYQDSEHFFSYRRTGEKQVQWSGIVSL